MSTTRCEVLRWQFDLVWSLFELHLEQLQPDDFLWEPTDLCWTMHETGTGGWVPDWAEVEPEPIPVPTVGWLTWHIGWWWSVALDHARGDVPRDRADIAWPGPGQPTVDWLRALRDAWHQVLNQLDDTDLDAVSAFPWNADTELTMAHMIAWANAELMKNAAEVGQLRLLRAARRVRSR